MNDDTRVTIQSVLDIVFEQSKTINRLQAYNALQTQALIAILSKNDSFTDLPSELIEGYEKVRQSSLDMIELGDNRGAFDEFLRLLDIKFLSIYD